MAIKPTLVGVVGSLSGDKIVSALTSLTSPNKLPITAIENAVLSVNGRSGNVVLNPLDLQAQPLNTNLTKISSAVMQNNCIVSLESQGNVWNMPYTTYGASLISASDGAGLRTAMGLSEASIMPVDSPNGLLKLDQDGKIPLSKINSSFATVASTGNYNDLIGKPSLFSGSYNDLTNKPSLFSGNYIDLIGRPNLSPVASSGSYNDLTDKPSIPQSQINSDWNSATGPSAILNKPVIFSGAYSDLTGKPALFSGNYSDLSGRPNLSSVGTSGSYSDLINKPVFSTVATTGSYNDLSDRPAIPQNQVNSDWNSNSGVSQILNKPNLFSGAYADLTGKPVLFDGDYNSLSNKPVIPVVNYPVVSVNSKTGQVVLTNTDVGAAATQHTHVIDDVAGLQSTLNNKITTGSSIPYATITGTPVIPAAQIQSDWSQTNVNALDYIKNKPTIPVINYPVLSVNTKTGAVVLNNTDVGAAATVHTHPISEVTGLQTSLDSKISVGSGIPYSTLTGAPSIPVNNSFTFKGLSDTDDVAIANGFLRWNTTGTSVSYSTTIPYSSISGTPVLSTVATTGSYVDLTNKPTLFDGTWLSLTGKPTFSTVATTGSYTDLLNRPTIPSAQVQSDWNATTGVSSILNKPVIPSTTTQISEGTNLYYTDVRVGSYLTNNSYRKVETLQGLTNASGVYTVTFANTYTTAPHVNPFIVNGTPAQMVTVSNITTTGCTVTVQQRNSVTLLGLEVLLAATVAVPNATVGVLVVSRT